MQLFEKIKDLQLLSRKGGLKLQSNLFTTLIGEVQRKNSKSPSDEEVLAVIKKMLKDINDNLYYNPDNEVALTEKSLLTSLLPKQASREEILEVISECERNLGAIMKQLKLVFGTNFDAKLAKDLFNETN